MKLVVKDILIKLFLVVLTLLNVSDLFAEDCKIVVSGSDMMRYDTNEINISKNCKIFVITLKHSGNLTINSIGHNIVFLETKDYIKN